MHTAATCITLNDSLAEVTYLLIRFSKTKSFLWKTKNTDKKGIDEQKTHQTKGIDEQKTHRTKRGRWL